MMPGLYSGGGGGSPGGGAPADATYLVTTADPTLTNEEVVGTTPGGELGGTWASPTVDATHSGSTHAATQAAAEATAAAALAGHVAAADPHTGYVLESLFDAKGDLISATADNTPAKVSVGVNDTILMADSAAAAGLKWVAAATPSTQAFGDVAAEGTSDTYTRGDHKHAMPANPVTAHEAAADPHTGYQKESEKSVALGYASLDAGTKVPTVELGGAGATSAKFLRGDQTWQTVSATVLAEFHIPMIQLATEVAF